MKAALSSTARTLFWRTRNELKHARGRLHGIVDSRQDLGRLLRLNTHGVVQIPGFLQRDRCAELVAELDRVLSDYRERLWIDAVGSDHRAYAADRVSESIACFGTNPQLLQLGNSYIGTEIELFFTLANRVERRPSGLGSGGGWHRDTAQEHQFKAILYLGDVGPENGPFEYILGSHRLSAMLKTTLTETTTYGQYRFSDEEVSRICDQLGRTRTVFSGGAGTLLLVDSSGIHRGMPIRRGTRYALTNYYFTPEQITGMIARKKFTNYFVDRTGTDKSPPSSPAYTQRADR